MNWTLMVSLFNMASFRKCLKSSSEMDLSSTFSCSPTHLSTCLFPFSPLWPIIKHSSRWNVQIHSFFATHHLILSHYLSFGLHLPLSHKSKTEMFGVLQPHSIRQGSLRGNAASFIHLLLHNSHHYGKQHLAFIQLHAFHIVSSPPIILTSLHVLGQCCTDEDISCCDNFFWTIFSLHNHAFLFVEKSFVFHKCFIMDRWLDNEKPSNTSIIYGTLGVFSKSSIKAFRKSSRFFLISVKAMFVIKK